MRSDGNDAVRRWDMSVSSINTAAQTAAVSKAATTSTRASDGDYKVRSAATSQTKDADGDYKAAKPAAATSSSAVQSAVNTLVKGG